MDKSLYLKWLTPADEILKGRVFNLINRIVVCAEDAQGFCKGFTVLEARSFDQNFIERLQTRLTRPDMLRQKFRLFAPESLKRNVEKFFSAPGLDGIAVHYTPFVKVNHNGLFLRIDSKMRVVNVDDSPVLLKLLKHTFETMGFVEIVAQVSDSMNASQTILDLKPDFVTMDIQMPGKTGVAVVEEVLQKASMPILMISSLSKEDGSLVFDALNAGAFDYLQKPKLEEKTQFQQHLREKLLLAVQSFRQAPSQSRPVARKKAAISFAKDYPENLVWCIGSSTGGTQALTRIFTSLPTHVPPTVIVQHIPPVFSKSFAESLNNLCPFTVKEAEDGDVLKPDHVYIAPGGFQLGFEQSQEKVILRILDSEPVNRFKPSVDFMFMDIARMKGLQIVAGILTGMGKDGAAGLLRLKQSGARTFAQDEVSSAVFGMPRAAIELGAVDTVAPLDGLAEVLLIQSSKPAKAA